MRVSILLPLIALAAACADDDPCAGVRDLVASPNGLELTEGEHALGWAHTDCFTCHQAQNIHEADCSTGDIDVSEIAEDASDTLSCADCHGDNGVEEWVVSDDTGQ